MNTADKMVAKIGPTERHLSGEGSDQQLRTLLENLERADPWGNAVEQEDLHSGIAHRETSEPEAIYHRPVAIENETKRRDSRGFARYLVAILIGVAATLAWQSYSDAAKQVIATNAPELGWSPEAKQMIAGWVQQFGRTKPAAGSEKQMAPVAQTAPATLSLDPEQVQRMARDLATLRQTVEQLAAGQDQATREIVKLEAADVEILAKVTPAPPPPRPIAAAARKPTLIAPPTAQAPIPPRLPPHP
jgi:hypothetical protein